MPINILMPALSPTMTEGNLVKWLKKEGDKIKAGDVLAEIETDKATMEVEAVDEGTLGKIVVEEGSENVKVNALIAVLLEAGESVKDIKLDQPTAEPSTSKAPSQPQETTTTTEKVAVAQSLMPSSSVDHRIKASPLAKKIAATNNITLNNIKGSGPHGRIIKSDILSQLGKPTSVIVSSTGPNTFDDVKLTNMRKVIAKRLTESKQNVPHFYLTIDCHIDKLLELRQEINHTYPDLKVSVNDLVMKACALAIKENPKANASWQESAIRYYHRVDLAMAVAIDGGLITPVICGAEAKSISDIAQEAKSLAQRAREGSLKPEEYQDGTFCITNLGMFKIKQFDAIINPPQACILAVGAGEKRAVVKNDALAIATVMTCTLSTDHRVVDGALGAQFLNTFKSYIEAPLRMLV